MKPEKFERLEEHLWEVPRYQNFMRVPARIYASEKLLKKMQEDLTIQQGIHVTALPGIVSYSEVMPDGHQGYGFPIGGVAAFDYEDGVISPGGVGYDINCGIRLIKTGLKMEEITSYLEKIMDTIYGYVPAGIGMKGKIKITPQEFDQLLKKGSKWAIERGYGWEIDLERTEDGGYYPLADPSKVSQRAKERGLPQVGTLGGGNHFLEMQVIKEIFDPKIARAFGLEKGNVAILIHTGGRGISHEVCDDYLRKFEKAIRAGETEDSEKLQKVLNLERELCCAKVKSRLGKDYLGAMAACANYAWTNRQVITYFVRKSFEEVLGKHAEDLGMDLVYDVAHNIAKIEEYEVDGKKKKLVVHRKGATRSLPAFHPSTPNCYREIGQPVLIPGSMGSTSYILVGTDKAVKNAFGSTAHGAGREMSRTRAKKQFYGGEIKKELERDGIVVRCKNLPEFAEEYKKAYKDPTEVVNVCHEAGLAKKVASFATIGIIKG
ncbi:MAG: RtcB family protein [Candidatus Aenigmarchaeota archaeon]|nr:RtcB family protein [Candidatus Aenigmarchaeota archaeon]